AVVAHQIAAILAGFAEFQNFDLLTRHGCSSCSARAMAPAPSFTFTPKVEIRRGSISPAFSKMTTSLMSLSLKLRLGQIVGHNFGQNFLAASLGPQLAHGALGACARQVRVADPVHIQPAAGEAGRDTLGAALHRDRVGRGELADAERKAP